MNKYKALFFFNLICINLNGMYTNNYNNGNNTYNNGNKQPVMNKRNPAYDNEPSTYNNNNNLRSYIDSIQNELKKITYLPNRVSELEKKYEKIEDQIKKLYHLSLIITSQIILVTIGSLIHPWLGMLFSIICIVLFFLRINDVISWNSIEISKKEDENDNALGKNGKKNIINNQNTKQIEKERIEREKEEKKRLFEEANGIVY